MTWSIYQILIRSLDGSDKNIYRCLISPIKAIFVSERSLSKGLFANKGRDTRFEVAVKQCDRVYEINNLKNNKISLIKQNYIFSSTVVFEYQCESLYIEIDPGTQ